MKSSDMGSSLVILATLVLFSQCEAIKAISEIIPRLPSKHKFRREVTVLENSAPKIFTNVTYGAGNTWTQVYTCGQFNPCVFTSISMADATYNYLSLVLK
jgi:hypothetical protein